MRTCDDISVVISNGRRAAYIIGTRKNTKKVNGTERIEDRMELSDHTVGRALLIHASGGMVIVFPHLSFHSDIKANVIEEGFLLYILNTPKERFIIVSRNI